MISYFAWNPHKKLHNEYLVEFIGEIKEVLFERKTKDGLFEGHMSNYICVKVKSDEDISHKFKNVKINSIEDGVAIGTLS